MAMQALVMGFGGTGAHILTHLKDITVVKHGEQPESIEFLLFDTIADWQPGGKVMAQQGNAEETLAKGEEIDLDPDTEYFHLSDHDPDLKTYVFRYLSDAGNPEQYPHLKEWLHAPWLHKHIAESRLDIREGAAQQRQIGRFAIFQNVDRIVQKVAKLLQQLQQAARGASVNVWLVTSAAGGTGAGCFIDAAYLTRMAAQRMGIGVTVTGVVVLPNVYSGIPGISRARAYSLFREMERLQARPDAIDMYVEEKDTVFSRVYYDRPGRQKVARVPSRLFDDLFYLGDECPTEVERLRFFTSVANAMEPYLDEASGPELLRASINRNAAASSFGAARLYVPLETYETIFAWDEIHNYIKRATAPRHRDNRVVGTHAGAKVDRQSAADEKLRNLLALFDDLLGRTEKPENQNRAYAHTTLTSNTIVNKWYQFASSAVAGIDVTLAEEQAVKLAYLNPFVSLTEPDPDRVEPVDQETKTFSENKKTKGAKESQSDSRDRFARELDAKLKRYINEQGGQKTFKQGRVLVLEKISALIKQKIDALVLDELDQVNTFAYDGQNEEQGTALTRLHRELVYLLEDGGLLNQIDGIVGLFVETINAESARLDQKSVDALRELRESRKQGLWAGMWVERYQQEAREELGEYIAWFQKRELLKDMQQLVRIARERFAEWERVIRKVFNRLVLDEPDSAFYAVGENLEKMRDRLYRVARDRIARISCARPDPQNPDMDMQGYRFVLRDRAVGSAAEGETTLHEQTLSVSRWKAEVKPNGAPELSLVLAMEDETALTYDSDSVQHIYQDLNERFHTTIKRRLQDTDIFDYLLYLQNHPTLTLNTEYIAGELNKEAAILINAGAGDEDCKLVYREQESQGKTIIAESIQLKLKGVNPATSDPETTHSDRNSITVLRIKMPDIADIYDITSSKEDYIKLQTQDLAGSMAVDEELYRAQVFHPFRPELEAWFIERRYAKQRSESSSRYQIPPRLVRLLEEPAMMQAFVHCVATGAVEKDGQSWVWHNTKKNLNVYLTDAETEPRADLIRAAVVFALQKRQGIRGSLVPITLGDVRQSAVDMAQRNNATRNEKITHFIEHDLDNYLDTHVGTDGTFTERKMEQQKLGFRMIFEIYGDPYTRTELRNRMDLA